MKKNSQKLPNFSCEKCNYKTRSKKDYSKHILTAKHQILTNTNDKIPKIPKAYICECGIEYKHATSLS